MKILLRFSLLISLACAVTLPARATSVWQEGSNGQGNAGGSLANANVTTGVGILTDITGSLTDQTGGADMYEIYISDPADFSALTVDPGKNAIANPALYLFDANGTGLFGNDNDGVDAQAQIPAGTTDSLTAGLYYILIVPSGNLPENKNGDLIFGDLTNTTTLAVGSASPDKIKQYGLSLTTPDPADSGKNYDIELTGADFAVQTPEPATIAFTALGLAALALRRRRA